MDHLRKELREFKDKLYDLQADRSAEDIHKILEIKGLSDEATETLILLQSNSKADIQAIKLFQVKTLLMMTDKLETLIVEVKSLVDSTRRDIEVELIAINKDIMSIDARLNLIDKEIERLRNAGLLNNRWVKIGMVGSFIMLFAFVLHYINAPGAEWAGEFIKSILTLGLSDGSTSTPTTPMN